MFKDKQCLWRSTASHEHRAFIRHDGGLFSVYWNDDGASRERRIQSILTVDGRFTYVDPVGRSN